MGLLSKGLVAKTAAKRPDIFVHPHVNHQIVRFGKGLATLLAFIWHLFFWSVQILSVLDQGALRAKTLTTVNTLEGFLVGVNAFVDVEKRSVSKLFGAVGAWKWVFWHLSQEWSLIEMVELSIYI